MGRFLSSQIRYPETAKDAGKQGTVYVSFVVEKDGTISNIVMLKEVPGVPEFSKEAIRVVSIMPNWTPGKQNGKLVRVKYTLPVKFTLQ